MKSRTLTWTLDATPSGPNFRQAPNQDVRTDEKRDVVKPRFLFSLPILTLFLALAPTALASTWYVNGVSGSNSNNCKSPTTACKTIKHAISLAVSSDSIIVAAAIYKENLTISKSLNVIGSGASTTIIDGGGINTVIATTNAASTVTLSHFTIRNGNATGAPYYGGGISNGSGMIVNFCTVRASFANNGGGGIGNGARLTINRSTITGNSTNGDGGGINNDGVMTINDSTISGNKGGANIFATGGGISNNGMLTMNNSTIYGNTRITHGTGGIANNGGTLMINNDTINGNQGGIYVNGIPGSRATLKNSIVANNSGGNCVGVSSKGYNLSSDTTCNFNGPGDMNNSNPMLGPLQNNGGPTQTMALLPGSPAIDAGNPSGCTDGQGHLLTTDQRGQPRPDKEDTGGCDIGAYESQSVK